MSALSALRRWPADVPLVGVLGANRHSPLPFSLLASPVSVQRFDTLGAFLDGLLPVLPLHQRSTSSFGAGWVVSIAYHAGRELEPSAGASTPAMGACIQRSPSVIAARVESGLVIDHRTGVAHGFGDSPPTLLGSECDGPFSLGPIAGLDRREAFVASAGRVVGLIHAGDAFQVNLAHRLSAPFAGSARALAAQLCESLTPWHGCYLEVPSGEAGQIAAIASMSPELFLHLTPDGLVRTRPMKGTRPGSTDSGELELAPKDRAELAMIVDLMRNDLGRVAAFGSVRVTQERVIEGHGGTPESPALWQGVATVEGRLREGLDVRDLLRATFPPGSVTGAPKVRAMQIIDELEPALGFTGVHTGRGPYCGCCGFIGDDGSAILGVAIRTAIVTGLSRRSGIVESGEVSYPVGAGIVADSDPESEWNETLDKARPFIGLCGLGRDLAED